MIEDIIREQNRLRRDVDGIIKPERSIDLISSYLALPGLVGFWPFSSVDRSTGNVYDLSGQNRTLTYNGNPRFGIYNNIVPYADLDGTGDYFSRADEAALDISGTEAQNINPGLTMGAWVWFDALGIPGVSNRPICGKTNSAWSYILYLSDFAPIIQAVVSSNGTANPGFFSSVASSATIVTGAWYYVVMKWIPSVEISLWINGVKFSNTASIIASIANTSDPFDAGRAFFSQLLDGRISLCFLCANALPDALIGALFQQARGAFGI